MFIRSKNNPIIKPNEKNSWRSGKTYNPGVVFEDGIYHLFYRAVGQAWVSEIGYGKSEDGENFACGLKPALKPEEDFEKDGIEDPRITKIKNTYYLTYNAYDGDTARLCLATSSDLKNWSRRGPMFPAWEAGTAKSFTVSWDSAQQNSEHKNKWVKSGAIFPQIIKRKYWMLFGDRNIWLANSKDGLKWKPNYEPLIEPRKGNYFDSVHVETGPPPIKTNKGWLALYHGIDKNRAYRLGYLLLDLNNPAKIIYRAEKSIFEPKETYELNGIADIFPGGLAAMEKLSKEELDKYIKKAKNEDVLPGVIFCCGAVLVDGKLKIYYGGADTVVCTAKAKLDDILNSK